MKILFTGGGSWGHVSPIVSVYPYLKKDGKFDRFAWVGSGGFEQRAAEKLGVPYFHLATAKVRRYASWKNITDIFVLFASFFKAYNLLRKEKPDVIFSTGGYVSVPVMLMGKLLHIKTIMHEQTVSLGLANKVGTMVADKILLSSELSIPFLKESKRSKAIVVGNPIRDELFTPADIASYFEFKDASKKLLYVTGGSQGAQVINEAVFGIVPELVKEFNIIHQCGKGDYEKGNNLASQFQGSYFAEEFIGQEIAAIYQHADIVIARAGANTVNELAVFNIPTIFIPLEPCNNDEQTKNAENFLKNHSGKIVRQAEANGKVLLKEVENLGTMIGGKRVIPQSNPAALEIVKQMYSLI